MESSTSGAGGRCSMGSNCAMNKYLVVYDYGQGGRWAFVVAESPDQLRKLYPELKIVSKRPEWMDEAVTQHLEENETYRVTDQPSGLLAELVSQRM